MLLRVLICVAGLSVFSGTLVAQDAAWLASPTVAGPAAGTFDFNAAANWSPAGVPTGTASFGASSGPSLSFSTDSTLSAWNFSTGASNYTFTNAKTLQFTGAGIAMNGGAVQILNNNTIEFFNGSTSGSAAFTNTLANLNFHDTSNAGNSTIVNSGIVTSGGLVYGPATAFMDSSSAGSAHITNNAGGIVQFGSSSTAATAVFDNGFDVFFFGNSTAGHATINNAGLTILINGNPVNTNGALAFFDSSNAGNATITNNFLGHVLFTDNSSAANATINTNNGGAAVFLLNGSGGQAKFVTNAGGTFDISGLSSSGSTAGSIEGAGSYLLGSKSLTVGSLNTDTEVSGTISGAGGALIKVGSGRLTLSGNNLYSGGTTISAGTLQIGNGGSSGSIAGDVTNNGVLAINRSDTYGFGGTISGNGSFQQNGVGTAILTAINTYSGATAVDAGTLQVGGSIALSSLTTVNNAGALTGVGTVGATQINAGGILRPGNGAPGSSMTLASLAMVSGAQYLIQLDPTTSSFASISGTASLGGATVNAFFAGGSSVEKQYTILTAGNVSGTFDPTIVNTNLPSGFKASLSYDSTHAYLDLSLNFVSPSGSSLSSNQTSVGNAIVDFFNRTGSIPLVFGALTPAGLSQLSGEINAGSQQTTFQAVGQFMNVMTDPFIAGRSDPFSAGNTQNAFAGQNLAYAAPGRQSKNVRAAYAAVHPAPVLEQRWGLWASGFGGSQTTDGNPVAGSNNKRSSVYGVAAGADYRLSPDTTAGFALSGGATSFATTGMGIGRSDLFQAGAFVRHNVGAAYLVGALAYGWQDVTTDRTVAVVGTDRLQAKFSANTASARLEGGYRFVTYGLGLTPYAAGQFTAIRLPSYAEQAIAGGNTFALNYVAQTVIDTRSELGVRTDKSFAMAEAVLILRGRATWAHDFNNNRVATPTFQTLPGASFVVNGAAMAPDSVLVTASAEMKWLNGWSAAATFEGEFSRVTESYAGKSTIRYVW